MTHTFRYVVDVETDTADHADTVMDERILNDEQYEDEDGSGLFDYRVNFRTMTVDEVGRSTTSFTTLHERFPELALAASPFDYAWCQTCGSLWTTQTDAIDDQGGFYVEQFVNVGSRLGSPDPTHNAKRCDCKDIHDAADEYGFIADQTPTPASTPDRFCLSCEDTRTNAVCEVCGAITVTGIVAHAHTLGITADRLKPIIEDGDRYGELIHAFEAVTCIGLVYAALQQAEDPS